MRFTKKKQQIFFNHFIEFSCIKCKAEIHRIDLIIKEELQSSEIIKGCEHIPRDVPMDKRPFQRKDKEPEKLGGVRF